MAGLVPAIQVFRAASKDADARHKAGHDGLRQAPYDARQAGLGRAVVVIAGLVPAIHVLI